MSKEVDVTAYDKAHKENLESYVYGTLKIETPVCGQEVKSLEMNGVSYPLEGLRHITFEVSCSEINTLRLEYIPKGIDSGD